MTCDGHAPQGALRALSIVLVLIVQASHAQAPGVHPRAQRWGPGPG